MLGLSSFALIAFSFDLIFKYEILERLVVETEKRETVYELSIR